MNSQLTREQKGQLIADQLRRANARDLGADYAEVYYRVKASSGLVPVGPMADDEDFKELTKLTERAEPKARSGPGTKSTDE